MCSKSKVAVLGAGGHTGRFVIDALIAQGCDAIAITREGSVWPKRDAAIHRMAHLSDLASLDAALSGAEAVINCAGPFFDTAIPVARAALRAGIPYLDVTAEQWTAKHLFETLNVDAMKHGVTLVPSVAFYGGLADLLVSAIMPESGRADRVEIAIALDSWQPTRGTRLTGEKNHHKRLVLRNSALVPMPDVGEPVSWSFPEPFGDQPMKNVALSEMVLMALHFEIGAANTYINAKPLEDLANPETPPPQAVDPSGRSAQRFIMDARVTAGGKEFAAIASGQDIYASTAPLIVKTCLKIIRGETHLTGVRAVGELFDARAFLVELAPDISVEYASLTKSAARQQEGSSA